MKRGIANDGVSVRGGYADLSRPDTGVPERDEDKLVIMAEGGRVGASIHFLLELDLVVAGRNFAANRTRHALPAIDGAIALTMVQRVFSCVLLAASASSVMEPSTTLAATSSATAVPAAINNILIRLVSTANSPVVAEREGDAPLK
jgi:hypothetical protein